MEFVFKTVGDLGALLTGSMVVIGDKLGLYRALAGAGPLTAAELADRTGTTQRYVYEWLCAQAAAGYVTVDDGDRFTLPAEHAIALTDESSPACVVGGFELMLAAVRSTDRLVDGVEARLKAGARIADVGCGHGASSVLLAQAFPQSTVTGIDYHAGSIEAAQQRAAEAGVGSRTKFTVGRATDLQGTYDVICLFDCLHDMGDPAGACAYLLEHLAADGALLIVEPFAGDSIVDNLNPVGQVYYAASTLLCTPNSLSQEVGTALGAQAGEARLREVVTGAGFTRFRRVAETPFNIVLEARP